MLNIYDKNGKHKATLNYTINEFKPSWYPEWEEGDLISATKLNNPIIDNGQIREMTREEQAERGLEVALNEGEIIQNKKIVTINKPENLIKAKWDKEANTWVEGYTEEEMFGEVDQIKAEILAAGYQFEGHNQKCRDKDIGLMTATIESLKDYRDIYKKDLKVTWYFDENDPMEMDLEKMKMLRLTGVTFVQKVYAAENALKTGKLQKVNKEQYLQLLK
ncbi:MULTISPECIES: hypothetical protein [unclassified Fusobacterium]|uniref:hypothetical protein n=1 Tax=unclassified Fusobacterium TaxID=2648384 RepID=UPI001B8C1DC9|nr:MULTISPECIES: hypothetical protein [unclassified Fusobacterium]MBR8702238.1 hypothetical protein [Fusobacterium sp. DD45]MBR8712061.1 hypothetical protein [Fusobacterium sp. DD28]MBR8752634.1 hypothetical protein [Fusobacterium sp. DD26]